MPGVDAQLLAELVDRHGAPLVLFASQRCRAPDDVVQQAFVELAACRTVPANPAAWLFAVVRRRAISRARAERSRARHEQEAGQRWFEQSRTREQEAATAAEMLAELPISEREIVVAYLYGRLTFEEIGRLVGVSTSTARRNYEAALSRLRERIGTPCPKKET